MLAAVVPLLSLLPTPARLTVAPTYAASAAEVALTGKPMLGGNVSPGEWAAVRVRVENDGPTIDGELRITSRDQDASTYGVSVQLATGARQEHILYGRAAFFGSRFDIALVSGGSVVSTIEAPVDAIEPGSLGVFVVAERPERLVSDIRDAVTAQGSAPPQIVAVRPEDLPPRVEAWSPVDRLVWQDVDAALLTPGQLEALRTWISVGGHLVVLGGSTGTTTLGAFPDDLLPYRPDHVIDVPVPELETLLGTTFSGMTALPALAGELERGTVLAGSGEDVIAARAEHGEGSVSVIGIDLGAPGLAGSSAAGGLFARFLPPGSNVPAPLAGADDGFLLDALGNLPSVQVPPMDQLFLLFAGYVVLIGPVNYLVLRRLDRREWGWVTMPAVIVGFTVAAFVLGIVLKGTSVVVNELAVVRGAAGTDRGVADVYVGIFSPNRATFDVRVAGGALISEPASDQREERERALDVLFGDPATLRGYEVGFGVLRGFRAEAAVSTPRVDAALELVEDRLVGTISNASDVPLDHVSILYGDGVAVLDAMAPGETRGVDLGSVVVGGRRPLADRMFGGASPTDAAGGRRLMSRRAVIQYLSGDWQFGPGTGRQLSEGGPVILAWRSAGALEIDVGTAAERRGDTLFVLPARALASGAVVFGGSSIHHSVVDTDAVEAFEEPGAFYLARGTMTVQYRPSGLAAIFEPTALTVRLGREARAAAATGAELAPLPASEQPDPEDPVGSGPAVEPGAEGELLPQVQLFDRVAGSWVEFPPVTASVTYRIDEPGRYVDASGSFLVRFVNRASDAGSYFSFDARLEGTAR